MENRDNLYYSTNDVLVTEVVQIVDVYEELLKYEAEGKFVVLRYNEQTVERQNELVDLIAEAIIRENFYVEDKKQQEFMKNTFLRLGKRLNFKKKTISKI